MAKKQAISNKPMFRVNDEIRAKQVRIVGEGIESRVISIGEARRIAEKSELDLIEINGSIDPPIVKIGNYEKMLYEMKKAAKKNKQHVKSVKEIQLSVNIAEHDLAIKANQAKKFIEDGSKVKVILKFHGRELARRKENEKSILEFITMLDEVALPESMPKSEGNNTIVILKKK